MEVSEYIHVTHVCHYYPIHTHSLSLSLSLYIVR